MYESYVRRQEADIEAYRKDENLVFPKGMDFALLAGFRMRPGKLRDSKAADPWSSRPNTGHNPCSDHNFASTRAGAGSSTQASPGGKLIKNGWSRGLFGACKCFT